MDKSTQDAVCESPHANFTHFLKAAPTLKSSLGQNQKMSARNPSVAEKMTLDRRIENADKFSNFFRTSASAQK